MKPGEFICIIWQFLIMAGLLRTFCLNPTECYLPIEKYAQCFSWNYSMYAVCHCNYVFVWHTRQYRLFFPVTAAFILIYFFAILYLPKRVSKKKSSKKSRNFPGSDNYTCYREDSRYNQIMLFAADVPIFCQDAD